VNIIAFPQRTLPMKPRPVAALDLDAERKLAAPASGIQTGATDWRTLATTQRIAFGLKALDRMRPWLGRSQAIAVRETIRTGEERDFFIGKLLELEALIAATPATRGQEEVEDPIVHLHYFGSNCDAWIIEKDIGYQGEYPGDPNADKPEDFQSQMFGYMRFSHMPECAELGYISLPELQSIGVELDFYWTPTPLSEVKAKLDRIDRPAPESPPEIQTANESPSPEESPGDANPLSAGQQPFIAMADGYQVGAILACSWGYDQTNVDFYRITLRTKAFVEFERLESQVTENQFMSGKCVPVDKVQVDRDGKPQTRRCKLRFTEGKPTGCKLESYAFAFLWDGTPQRCSWYA
jgi:hypothetical protein